MSGSCNRSGRCIYRGGGNMTTAQCQWEYGKDGSLWASDLSNSGVCFRVAPPISNAMSCCAGTANSFDSCGYSWCPTSPECVGWLGNYCAQPQNVTTDVCQKFCDNDDNKQFCDGAMRIHCQNGNNGSTDPRCACIASKIPVPSCMDAQCMMTGYKTTDHVRQKDECSDFCGVIIHCGAEKGSCAIDSNVANIKCNASTSMKTSMTADKDRMVNKLIIIIGAFALAAVFGLGLLLAWIFGKGDKDQ